MYPSSFAGQSLGTSAVFFVLDVEAEVEQLSRRGIQFDDYDFPGAETENGIATLGFYRAAWFKDPDGNIPRSL